MWKKIQPHPRRHLSPNHQMCYQKYTALSLLEASYLSLVFASNAIAQAYTQTTCWPVCRLLLTILFYFWNSPFPLGKYHDPHIPVNSKLNFRNIFVFEKLFCFISKLGSVHPPRITHTTFTLEKVTSWLRAKSNNKERGRDREETQEERKREKCFSCHPCAALCEIEERRRCTLV